MDDRLIAELSHSNGRAEIRWDHGDLVLLADAEDDSALLLTGYDTGTIARDWGAVLGGVTPPGTTRVEVRAETGRWVDGAFSGCGWIAIVDLPSPLYPSPVRFSDEAGQLVERPIPDSWERTPLKDVQEACPVCDTSVWEEVVLDRLDPLREMSVLNPEPQAEEYLRGEPPRPIAIIRCDRCGHVEGGARSLADPDPSDAAVWSLDVAPAITQEEMFDRVLGPIFAARDRSWRVGGWGGTDPVTSIDLVHPSDAFDANIDIEVRTFHLDRANMIVDDPWMFAYDALKRIAIAPEPFDEAASEGEELLRYRARERSESGFVAEAERSTDSLDIDGTPTEFHFASLPYAWAAWHRGDDRMIVVSARGLTPAKTPLETLQPGTT